MDKTPDSRPDRPFISVIIPGYNEGEHLRECLGSLCSQDYPRYEVIYVDNGSTDDTAKICAEFPGVRYVYFDRCKSSYAARNEGARRSRGELLAFFDADQTALPGYLPLLVEEYEPDDPYHVYCANIADDPRVPLVLRMSCSYKGVGDGFVIAGIAAVPRALFDELGGFQEHLLSGGDCDFFGRALKVAQLHVSKEVTVHHYWAKEVGEVLAREERYGFGHCLRAPHTGEKMPRIPRELARIATLGLTKLAAAALTPLRFPRAQWRDRWHAQYIHWMISVYRLRGVAKYKLGHRRAGDLPPDAVAARGGASAPRDRSAAPPSAAEGPGSLAS